MQHLAYIHPAVVSAIRDGRKTVESRLSIRACHPAHKVKAGDEILFKQTGGDVELYAMVERVDHYDDLRPDDIAALKELYAKTAFDIPGMNIDEYIKNKRTSKHATFIWLTDICSLHVPKAELPSSRMGWIANWPSA